MKLTNVHGLPRPLVNAVERDDYSKGDAWISVTGLINSPRVHQLRRMRHSEMVRDVSDLLWPLAGKAMHKILEMGGDEEHLPEERLFMEVAGWRISGAIDVQKLSEDRVAISDYKFTSSWAVMNGKADWESQLNCYGELVERATLYEVESLQVVALVRDWDKHRLGNPLYPQTPIVVVPIPLWSPARRLTYIRSQLQRHIEARRAADRGASLPHCTDEERWTRPASFAVMKSGNKKASRVTETREQAEAYIKETKKPNDYAIDERPVRRARCEGNYCGVAQWCEQWQQDRPADPPGPSEALDAGEGGF